MPVDDNRDMEGSPLSPKTPAEKVRFILEKDEVDAGYEVDHSLLSQRSLFCQMDMLCHFDDGVVGWKEMARWLKYEEKVESGDRWSKPHVSTTSLHALTEVRRSLAEDNTLVLLDLDPEKGGIQQVAGITPKMLLPPIHQGGDEATWNSFVRVAERIAGAIQEELNLSAEKTGQLMQVLLRPHKHKHRGGSKNKGSQGDKSPAVNGSAKSPKKKGLQMKYDLDEMDKKQQQFPGHMKPDELKKYKPNKRFMRKIPGGSEVANILVGQVDFLNEPISVFVRLAEPTMLADLTEVALPTRFLYIVLGPTQTSHSIWEYGEQGRSMATLLTDKVFCEVAYKANGRQDLLDGLDEFMDDLTVLPPSIWDPNTRLEPPTNALSPDKIAKRLDPEYHSKVEGFSVHEEDDSSLQRTGRLFGGLIMDMKRRYPQYLSDLTDAIHMQTVASIFFMFFACITPIVTFGGLMGDKTDQYMGVMECILSGAICGFIYAIFAAQPLTIVGATGPLLIFESIVYLMCKSNDWEFLCFRFWIGMWVCAILFIIVMFDLSALVRYITRFTEESFAVLISIIFTYEAFHKVIHIWETHPVETGVLHQDENHTCLCNPNTLNATEIERLRSAVTVTDPSYAIAADYNETVASAVATTTEPPIYNFWNWTQVIGEECITFSQKINVMPGCVTQKECLQHWGTVEGEACDDNHVAKYVPNVFFLSCFLFLGTFGIAYFLRCFRTMRFFPAIVRQTLADFAVLISIIICTSVDITFALPTPKLTVPSKFETTNPNRNWFVNPVGMKPENWWIALVAFLPAALATILIFLDQQITAVIVNRKEHKLKKGHGYHLDLFVLMFLIGICSMLGLPWFVAATVRALTHVKSLFKESEVKIPGEKPFHLGVREQRVTGIIIHILIASSIFLTSILKFIPMPVLYGVFLYMGITSLGGVQFVDRIGLLLMPVKYQPDYIYLRHVRTSRVHIFTVIQLLCFAGMWIIKQNKKTAIGFPLMLLILCVVRKLMDFFFTQSELYWLDHLLPEATRRLKEDEAKKAESDGQHLGDHEMKQIKAYDTDGPATKGLLDGEKYPMGEDDLLHKRDHAHRGNFNA